METNSTEDQQTGYTVHIGKSKFPIGQIPYIAHRQHGISAYGGAIESGGFAEGGVGEIAAEEVWGFPPLAQTTGCTVVAIVLCFKLWWCPD